MKQLLDLTRLADYYPAYTFLDEKQQSVVNVDEDLAKSQFERFMQVREEVRIHKQEVQGRLIAIGYALLQIKNDELYHYVTDTKGTYGYSSFYAFVKDVFGVGKSFACCLINVAREFCEKDGIVKLGYGRYSFSQLESMLTVDEKYRERIPVKCSARDIKHLGKLYETNPPKEDTTVEEDLELWRKLHKEEQARKNAKKNAIVFVPARKSDNTVQTSGRSENLSTQGEISFPGGENPPAESENGSIADDFDGEDERDIITPEEKKIPYEAIKEGLLRQLELLLTTDVGVLWKKAVDIFKDALFKNTPTKVVSHHDLVQSKIKCGELEEQLKAVKSGKRESLFCGKSGEKLNLKNEKARREWLEDFRSWGVWLDIPEVQRTYYRYNFVNGYSLIVSVWLQYRSFSANRKAYEEITYTVLDKDHTDFDGYGIGGISKAIEWLTKNAKEI